MLGCECDRDLAGLIRNGWAWASQADAPEVILLRLEALGDGLWENFVGLKKKVD